MDLGNLGQPFAMATAMNNAGEVVGIGDVGDGMVHLFRWRRGVMTDLGVKGVFQGTNASGIDDRGRVIGVYTQPGVGTTGFLWEEGAFTMLPFAPTVMNNRLQIAGGGPFSRAYVWDNGDFIEITPPGSGGAFVNGINERGQVILNAFMPTEQPEPGSVQRAMMWHDGQLIDLGDLGGANANAMDINDRGEITGWSETPTGVQRAFVWRDGVMRQLESAGVAAEPWALNNRGQAVGRLMPPDFLHRPVIWNRSGMIDLGTDGRTGIASHISEQGDVAGIDANPADTVMRPFLWRRGTFTEMPRPPGTTTVNLASMNRSASKLAGSIYLDGQWHAVLWLIH